MKIATWNLARVQSKYKIPVILEKIKEIDADILILTETSTAIDLSEDYFGVQSIPLPTDGLFDTVYYNRGENRTAIWSKYPIVENISTSNDYTNTCAKLKTPFGNFIFYAAIIGFLGRKNPYFQQDLENVQKDLENLSKQGNICLAGDFNLSFCDNYFPDRGAKQKLKDQFQENNLMNLTEEIPNNIDHIVINKDFIRDFGIEISIWNEDKKLSDHKGVSVTLKKL